MAMTVFPCRSADLDDLVPLFDAYRQFYGQDSDLSSARMFLHDRLTLGDSIILAVRDDARKVVGFTQLYRSFSSVRMVRLWILNDLYVAPEARDRGFGRLLMEAAAARAREAGVRVLALATQKDNVVAKSLYESLGWVRDTEFDYYELTW